MDHTPATRFTEQQMHELETRGETLWYTTGTCDSCLYNLLYRGPFGDDAFPESNYLFEGLYSLPLPSPILNNTGAVAFYTVYTLLTPRPFKCRCVGDKELLLTKQMIDERTALDVESIAHEVKAHSLIVHGDADNTTPFVCSWGRGTLATCCSCKRACLVSQLLYLRITKPMNTARIYSYILPW